MRRLSLSSSSSSCSSSASLSTAHYCNWRVWGDTAGRRDGERGSREKRLRDTGGRARGSLRSKAQLSSRCLRVSFPPPLPSSPSSSAPATGDAFSRSRGVRLLWPGFRDAAAHSPHQKRAPISEPEYRVSEGGAPPALFTSSPPFFSSLFFSFFPFISLFCFFFKTQLLLRDLCPRLPDLCHRVHPRSFQGGKKLV